MLALDNLLE
jgi:uncharacterized protein (TIGR01627 family)